MGCGQEKEIELLEIFTVARFFLLMMCCEPGCLVERVVGVECYGLMPFAAVPWFRLMGIID